MNVQINIDTASCIRCGKCVKVCPAWIMTQAKPGDPIGLRNIDSCIVCGHCAAVCPTGSVRHSSFLPIKSIRSTATGCPRPNRCCSSARRRSNRALSDRPVPQEAIDRILEAAHRAPTASNRQEVSFTVITDPRSWTRSSVSRWILSRESPASGKPARQTHTQTSAA